MQTPQSPVSKAQSLSERMDELTEQFDLSDELTTTGEEVQEEYSTKIELYKENLPGGEVINLQIMVDDFAYIRETLKETTENGRRVLNVITADLLDADGDDRAELITAFADLNTAVCNNMKLYILSYKEISITLLNIDKFKQQNSDSPDSQEGKIINNTFNISTTDLIKSLKAQNDS